MGLIVRHQCSNGHSFLAVYGHVRNYSTGHVGFGQQIATVGPWSYGNHLHFGVYESDDGTGGYPYINVSEGNGWGMRATPRPGGQTIDGVLSYDRWFDPVAYIRARTPWGGASYPSRPNITEPAAESHFTVGQNIPIAWDWCTNDTGGFRYQRVIWQAGNGTVVDRWPQDPAHINRMDWNGPAVHEGDFDITVEVWNGDLFTGSERRRIHVAPAPSVYTGQNWTDAHVPAGSGRYFEVCYRNNTTSTWDQAWVHLGTSDPRDRVPGLVREDLDNHNPSGWVSANRVAMKEASVAPGDLAHFGFWMSVAADRAAGQTDVQRFEMVDDNPTAGRWFDGSQ